MVKFLKDCTDPIKGLDVWFSPATISRALKNVGEVMESGKLIYDRFIPELETRVRELVNAKIARAFSSDVCAQDALYDALGFRGRNMVFQGNIFSSPVFTAQRQGITPIWCDVDPATSDICLHHLEKLLKSHDIAAVHQVSQGGQIPRDIPQLKELCYRYGALLIEDAAHSFGSSRVIDEVTYNSGGFADYTIFSFYGTKTTGFGTGGMIVSDNVEMTEKAAQLGRYGRETFFGLGPSQEKGYSYRMNEITAAVGCAVLDDLPEVLRIRRKLAGRYIDHMREYGILFDYGSSNFYKFPIRLPRNLTRQALESHMAARHITLTRCTGIPTYTEPAFGDEFKGLHLSGCEDFCRRHSCLPMHERISEEDQHRVMHAFHEALPAAK